MRRLHAVLLGLVLGCAGNIQAADLLTSWGADNFGQCGLGTTVPLDSGGHYNPMRVPESSSVTTLANVSEVTSGGYHTLARMSDGSLRGWGQNTAWQLGLGFTDNENKLYATVIPGASGVRSMAAGELFSLAVLENNTVLGWGNNASGQLGMSGLLPKYAPTAITSISGVSNVAAGVNFTVFQLTDGSLKSCGNNADGQLGLGEGQPVTVSTPTTISGINNARQVSCGNTFAGVVQTDGTVKMWGRNQFGQLGVGDQNTRYTPTAIPDISSATAIACGGFHTLILLSDGTVKSFGLNTAGQLGLGDITNRLSPETIQTLSGITQIAAGENFSMALKNDGTVWTWGLNANGQLGLGDVITVTNREPKCIAGLRGVKQIAAGSAYALALTEENAVLEVTPEMRDFGQVEVGSLGTKSFTAKNIGFGSMTLNVDVASPFEPSYQATIDEGLSRVVTLSFRPESYGSYSNNVTFSGAYSDEVRYVLAEGIVTYTVTVASAVNACDPIADSYPRNGGSLFEGHVTEQSVQSGSTQWVYSGWTYSVGTNTTSGSSTQTSFTVEGNTALTWLWTTQYQCTASGSTGGTVAPASDWVTTSSSFTPTATASNGFAFSHWTNLTENSINKDNPATVNITRPTALQAVFVVPLAPPTGLTATTNLHNKIELTWQPVLQSDGYELWRAETNNTNSATRVQTLGIVTNTADSSVQGNTDYYYWVKTLREYAGSPFSTSVLGRAASGGLAWQILLLGNQ